MSVTENESNVSSFSLFIAMLASTQQNKNGRKYSLMFLVIMDPSPGHLFCFHNKRKNPTKHGGACVPIPALPGQPHLRPLVLMSAPARRLLPALPSLAHSGWPGGELLVLHIP